jgi:hypothetical protein
MVTVWMVYNKIQHAFHFTLYVYRWLIFITVNTKNGTKSRYIYLAYIYFYTDGIFRLVLDDRVIIWCNLLALAVWPGALWPFHRKSPLHCIREGIDHIQFIRIQSTFQSSSHYKYKKKIQYLWIWHVHSLYIT